MKNASSIKPNRHDLILAAVILAAAGICALFIHFHNEEISGNNASRVTAGVDGEEYGTWSLDEDQLITFDTEYGHNVLEIKDGEARMVEADCPDGYCMQQSAVSGEHPERTIVCLPHRLVIRAVNNESDAREDTSEGGGVSGAGNDGSSSGADGEDDTPHSGTDGADDTSSSGTDDEIDAVAGH